MAFRTYLPGLSALAGRAVIAACFDPVPERATRFADAVAAQQDAACAPYTDLAPLLAHPGLDGVLNLTPAPFHAETTTAILDAGLNCFSEKPIAGSLDDARRLTALARERGLLFLCAPATMATNRFQWLKRELDNGLLGRPTLMIGQMANMGPAAWRDYKGDPAVFYTDRVGPVLDIGVYLLHAVTGLLGPATFVSAVGGIVIPERIATIPTRFGERIAVTGNDHMLLHLEWEGPTYAQILASFATPATRTPVLEIHGERGTICIPDIPTWYDLDAPVDLLLLDRGPVAHEAWRPAAPPERSPVRQPIQAGPLHFVEVLEGVAEPILTAEHATHVLEIIRAAERSAAAHGEPVALA
ncbi:MAG: Gfo/Idh/MocA family oxidoreductase [Thermomicrobiales bacterium]|nr:Gfo/Idh/MocA family oxidoreductase [Thermomicrobiales bacterium]